MRRLPERKKKGDPILAEDWNRLLDALEARTPRQGVGLRLDQAGNGGFAYSLDARRIHDPYSVNPFAPVSVIRTESAYEVILNAGWVIERVARAGASPAVKFRMPTAGGTALNTVPRPKLTMSLGDFAYCRFPTTIQGEISGTPTIEVSSTDHGGTHYAPADPSGSGTPGECYVKLIKLVSDGADGVTVELYQQSDIEHWAELWTGENVGGGEEVFKEHDEAGNIYKFRTIKQRDSQPQVTVELSADQDSIEVKGNGFGYSASSSPLNGITVVDGLVTAVSTGSDGGWWGQVAWYDGGGTHRLELHFEAGALVAVQVYETGGMVNVPGTEASPGSAEILV